MIFFADLPNMDQAVDTAYDSIYANMGRSVMLDLESMSNVESCRFCGSIYRRGQGATHQETLLIPRLIWAHW